MDARADRRARAAEPRADEREPTIPRTNPIVPGRSIASRTLVAVIAIMTFLASLTVGAVDLVRSTARTWESDVVREVTIQIRPTEGRDIEDAVRRATEIARATPGVGEARPFTTEESARLLEPWLGTGLDLGELPVPRLILVRIVEGGTADLPGLSVRLQREVAGASLDDHQRWVERLRSMTGSLVAIGLAILCLVMTATILSVVFATRGTMAGNREIVQVLNLVGASDRFVAREFQRRFLTLGLIGGAVGGGSALLLFLTASLLAQNRVGTPMADQANVLFGEFVLGPSSYLGILAITLLIALATGLTSRITVLRYLGSAE